MNNEETLKTLKRDVEALSGRVLELWKKIMNYEVEIRSLKCPTPMVGMHNVNGGWTGPQACYPNGQPIGGVTNQHYSPIRNDGYINPFSITNMFSKITYVTEITMRIADSFRDKYLFEAMQLVFTRDANEILIELSVSINPHEGSAADKNYTFYREDLEELYSNKSGDDRLRIRDHAINIRSELEKTNHRREATATAVPYLAHNSVPAMFADMKEYIKQALIYANEIAAVDSDDPDKEAKLNRLISGEVEFSTKELSSLKYNSYTSKETFYPLADMDKETMGDSPSLPIWSITQIAQR